MRPAICQSLREEVQAAAVSDFLFFVPFQILKRAGQHSREIILLRGSDDNERVRGIEPPFYLLPALKVVLLGKYEPALSNMRR